MASLPLETVLDMARSIPCSPAIIPGLLRLIEQDDIEIHSVERLIRTDTGLATAVLRLANSAYFGTTRKCEALDEAMLRLGSRTVYRLAATAAAGPWLSHYVQGYGWQAGDLCRHSLAVAVAAEVLCHVIGLPFAETAYTAGLVHDVGKLAMAYANFPALQEVEQHLGETSQSWRGLEQELIGYDFSDVTKGLLQSWAFPKSLVAVGTCYPAPRTADAEDRPLVTLIHAAKHVVIQLGYGVGTDGFYTELDEQSLAEHGFEEGALEAALPQILSRIEVLIKPDGQVRLNA